MLPYSEVFQQKAATIAAFSRACLITARASFTMSIGVPIKLLHGSSIMCDLCCERLDASARRCICHDYFVSLTPPRLAEALCAGESEFNQCGMHVVGVVGIYMNTEAQGHIVSIELKTGELYRGHLLGMLRPLFAARWF
jgi:hypothetical protein